MRFLGLMLTVLAAGCSTATHAFLGVPDNQERKIRAGALAGITNMTRVEPADFQTYRRLKTEGKITAEERSGPYVYYAVTNILHVPFQPTREGEASGAYIPVVMRYRAPIPPATDRQ